MKPEEFDQPVSTGSDLVDVTLPSNLAPNHLAALTAIVGEDNVVTAVYDRIRAAYGKTMLDLFRLRERMIENVPDAVIFPRTAEDVMAIVKYCSLNAIAVQPLGAGSSVTRGFEAVRGGVTLNLTKHMNRIIKIDPISETVTVESGMMGPALEAQLQAARETLQAPHNYTCGHFPQSFEYTTVGGWIVTRGAGQNSTYYGKAEDMVLAQQYVTPVGEFKTAEVPASATGPDIDGLMTGSEGTLGILVSATLRMRRFHPENRRKFSYIFPDF